ncbi:hypothetical protein I7X12_04465 [Halosimplex litoreum]|uniref:Uncharacterized protein n=1 Tax=Halosimplex litoreum TaxID=1198301 RepID=A0A7T3G026_9EURY|nr:hypothetical protein [Halosimplex litoreum]QPV63890.1 hypothetical protein I7X12_04465 [Halosimplex litoreum]
MTESEQSSDSSPPTDSGATANQQSDDGDGSETANPHTSSGEPTEERDSMENMTNDSETDETDEEQFEEDYDHDDVSILIDADGSWEARIESGEVIDTGEVSE